MSAGHPRESTSSAYKSHVARPYRKRIRLPVSAYADPDNVFHVTIRAAIGEVPFGNRTLGDQVWAELDYRRLAGSASVDAACLMPDHLHIVISLRSANVISWVQAFKSFTTPMWWAAGRRGSLWQPSFYDVAIRTRAQDLAAVTYVANNAEAAGLVSTGTEWPWEGLWVESAG